VKKLSEAQSNKILADCVAGDEDGWRKLFQYFHPVALWVAAGPRFCLSEEVSKDIAQRVMIDLCAAIQAGKVRNLSGYVRTAAYNKCVDLLRKKDPLNHRVPFNEDEDELENISYLKDIPSAYADSAAIEALNQCLSYMGNPCSDLLTQRYYGSKSYTEIALSLSLPAGQIGTNVARCLEKLKKLLEQTYPGFGDELAGLPA